MASVSGSYFYINMQKAQLAQLQVELQTAVNNHQRQNQARIAELSEANDAARQEVTEMRNTFARHDLNNLAIARPGLIEGIVNRGTARVHQQFVDLTNPRQFDEALRQFQLSLQSRSSRLPNRLRCITLRCPKVLHLP